MATEPTLTLEQLQQFFEERPALSHRAIGMEAQLSDSMMNKIMNGKRELTRESIDKLYPIIVKYGFKNS